MHTYSDMGRLFQIFGTNMWKGTSPPPPQLCLIRGICKACVVDERRLREGL